MTARKLICALISIIFVLAFCSCGTPESESTTEPTPVPTPISTPIPTTEIVIEVEPVLASYTTGFPIDERTEYKPIGVVIENSAAARPQNGLQSADIVYEAPVEGCTRFFCIYNDTLPENVGPVRSARIYFIKIQQEWDCAFAHFGGPESGEANVYLASSEHIKTRINFIKGTYNDYYWRISSRNKPHNAYTNVKKCQELMEEEAKVRTFNFDSDFEYEGRAISSVVLPFYSGEVTYRYNASKDLLLRYMGKKEFIDADTKKAVEVQNLIVQYNHFYHGNEAKGRWLCDLVGSGKADFFIGGKHIKGTWERADYDKPTIYKDSKGNEIVLQPGNTWIASHPDDKEITINY